MIHADAPARRVRAALAAAAAAARGRLAAFRAAAERRETLRAMARLDQSLLDDIGLTRNDVRRLAKAEGIAI